MAAVHGPHAMEELRAAQDDHSTIACLVQEPSGCKPGHPAWQRFPFLACPTLGQQAHLVGQGGAAGVQGDKQKKAPIRQWQELAYAG